MEQAAFDKELKELSGKLKIVLSEETSDLSMLDQWNKFYPNATPKQIYDKFVRAAGDGSDVRVCVSFSDNNTTSIIAEHDPKDGNSIIEFKLFDNGTAKLPWALFLRDTTQGQGLAKKYLHTGIKLLEQVGTQKISVKTDEIGGYAWAKYGFSPETKDDWYGSKENLKDKGLKKSIKERISEDGTVIKFRGKSYPINSVESKVINAVLNSNFLDLSKNFPHLTELNREIGKIGDKPLTVGKALLIGQQWNGVLPLDENHISFKRFKAYTEPVNRQLMGASM